MLLPALAIIGGFVLLVWSADRFVEGAAATAKHAGMPSLLIGMLIVGFGTSAPEMVVSAMAAMDGNPDLALGNALGSNIVNTGLILGVAAIIVPLSVHSKIIKKELPLLLGIALLVGYFILDDSITRTESIILLIGFFSLIAWSVISAYRGKGDTLDNEFEQELAQARMSLAAAIFWLVCGLVLLVVSSRVLVWGAVEIATALGVSDLVIGLTIVALGTSLPELAATVIAARKGEFEIALGNVVGSNMFNLLAVVGIAGVIMPMDAVPSQVLMRDWLSMMILLVALTVMAIGIRRPGRINRWEGGLLILIFTAYNVYLIRDVLLTGG